MQKQEGPGRFSGTVGEITSRNPDSLLRLGLFVQPRPLSFRTGDIPLSNLMRRLLTGYVVCFNRRHGRHGQLFQNRFKSVVCQEEKSISRNWVRYIHLNPIRAGLVASLARLQRYRCFGHGALLNGAEVEWQDTELSENTSR